MKTIEGLSYRTVEKSDFEKICKLPQNEEELFFMFPKAEYPFTPDQLEVTVNSRFDSIVVLKNGEAVGFANFYEVKKNEYCSIGNVVVSADFRNQGIGRYLIEAMEKTGIEKYHASEFHLSCFNTNTNGLLLYSKLGYLPYETERRVDKKNDPVALIKLRKVL
ncbi:MAG: GNAT family N-acetyltransferase [Tannerella sp.]|jgi:ribosomal protein S18 acetylase RimI-like enzyme|nr:GNAT family N-acetyltransferase [Tannerella sp.]